MTLYIASKHANDIFTVRYAMSAAKTHIEMNMAEICGRESLKC